MEEQIRETGSRYQQIAADIAAKIVDHQYQIGEKIYARSLIASQYAVSSETARRAIAVLTDLGVVDTVKGSGVIIKSYDNAVSFLKKFRNVGTMSELKRDALNRLVRLEKDGDELREAITRLVDHSDRFRSLNPLAPFSVRVESGSPCVGQNLSALSFWENTAATVVAIRRGEELLLSPGPYAAFAEGDMVYFVGEDECVARVDAMFQSAPL